MPEGPQVKRVANTIGQHRGVDILEITHPPSRQPWQIDLPVKIQKAEAVGKNLFIELDNGQIIYNHMLMWGRWGEGCAPNLGKKRLNTCFKTTKGSLGYYGGGVLKLITPKEAQEIKDRLGPDIITAKSMQEAFSKLSATQLPIGEALLDQSLVAGIGNIYKSEGMFVARINPFVKSCDLSDKDINKLYNFLHKQMSGDVHTGTIITTTPKELAAGKRRYVYRRYHQPCLKCGTKIERVMQGERLPRSTYFCSHCQSV